MLPRWCPGEVGKDRQGGFTFSSARALLCSLNPGHPTWSSSDPKVQPYTPSSPTEKAGEKQGPAPAPSSRIQGFPGLDKP